MNSFTHSVIISTNFGDIKLGLLGNHAPKTVENFVGLAEGVKKWLDPRTGEPGAGPLYKDLVFHRVIPGFMIQGGDPAGDGTGGPGYEFDDEIHPELNFVEPFVLAMANAGKRGGKGTNGSQFFITTAATTWLQGNHTIFGFVQEEESIRVVKQIESVPTDQQDRPQDDVSLMRISVTKLG